MNFNQDQMRPNWAKENNQTRSSELTNLPKDSFGGLQLEQNPGITDNPPPKKLVLGINILISSSIFKFISSKLNEAS